MFPAMKSWDLPSLPVEPHQPEVLLSDEEGRAIVINLPAGEQLKEHQVHERAWVVVAAGEVEIDDSGGETVKAGPGFLATFEPNERHELRATSDARILLVLSPWPGEGHPSNRSAA
jgi:quercetin dioxygenase-like cupin family protein